MLGLPSDKKLVLFGAFGGIGDKRKGFDLLREALQKLPDLYPVLAEQVELVIFGQSEPFESGDFSLRTRYFGQLSDDFNLNILYSACDVFMLPSRQDNCPLTIQESLSSGTPVVAFRTTGSESLLVHKSNGYLADFGSAVDLLNGIVWVLEGTESELSLASRNFAVNNFDSKIISKKYLGIYECVITDFIK
jgi:glycosyltransferase involved in cell wall biosynthesis